MTDEIIHIGEGFWNIRGSFRMGVVFDIGSQSSLVQLKSGDFVLLDAYTLSPRILEAVKGLTDDGRAVRALLNLHPFHTVHCRRVAEQFPKAALYGTRRHKAQLPELSWQPEHTEDEALHEQFADDLTFSVPVGVDFIPDNPNLHFASVLARHGLSKTLHVDDTLMWIQLPLMAARVRFHPALRSVLQPRAGAVAEFRGWVQRLLDLCDDVDQLCTAHMRPLPPRATASGPSVRERIQEAYEKVEKVLAAHERRYSQLAESRS